MTKHTVYDFSKPNKYSERSQSISLMRNKLAENCSKKILSVNMGRNFALALSRRRFGQGSDLTFLGKLIRR